MLKEALTLLLLLITLCDSQLLPKPPITNYPAVSRWALARASFGTLSTSSTRLNGAPWGSVAAVSDGIHSNLIPGKSTGTPYFYLTELDETATNIRKDSRASFSTSQATFPDSNYCATTSAEDPTCVRLTLSGNLVIVDVNSSEWRAARSSLFSKHPMMEDWPLDHQWNVYKLKVEDIFMLDFYGGSHKITKEEYFDVNLSQSTKVNIPF